MWKSLDTTKPTPLKCPGLNLPSSSVVIGPRSILISGFLGYISESSGTKAMSHPASLSLAKSDSKVFGYFFRSSGLLNCVGLTKMEATVNWDFFLILQPKRCAPDEALPLLVLDQFWFGS